MKSFVHYASFDQRMFKCQFYLLARFVFSYSISFEHRGNWDHHYVCSQNGRRDVQGCNRSCFHSKCYPL